MTDDLRAVQQMIDDTLEARGVVTEARLSAALDHLKEASARDEDLQTTRAEVRAEQVARRDLERRLGQLEVDVSAIDDKMGQLLGHVDSLSKSQTGLRSEVEGLGALSKTLLELSRARTVAMDHLLDTQSAHGTMLITMREDLVTRTQQLGAVESGQRQLSDQQKATMQRMDEMVKRFMSYERTLSSVETLTDALSSKRVRLALIVGLGSLVSSALSIDLQMVVELLVNGLS